MTIKEYAENHSITPQAIYKKLNSKGIQLSTIVEGKAKNITESGLLILNGLYPAESTSTKQVESIKRGLEEAETRIQEAEQRAAEAERKLEAQIQANEILSVKLQAAEQRAQDLQAAGEQRAKDLQAQIMLYESRVIPLLPKPQEATQPEKPFTIRQRLAILFTGTAPESKKEKGEKSE